jgi:ribosome-binding protein aMBF1 (putative translation factor)
MTTKKANPVSEASLAAARKRAEQARREIASKPLSELFTPQELADGAPFYYVLRDYVRQLKQAREAAGLTLAEISDRTGMAVESLSRLETGAQTNPTWKTLGQYAAAVGCRPRFVLEQETPT